MKKNKHNRARQAVDRKSIPKINAKYSSSQGFPMLSPPSTYIPSYCSLFISSNITSSYCGTQDEVTHRVKPDRTLWKHTPTARDFEKHGVKIVKANLLHTELMRLYNKDPTLKSLWDFSCPKVLIFVNWKGSENTNVLSMQINMPIPAKNGKY